MSVKSNNPLYSSGARTAVSAAVTLAVTVLSLCALTDLFFWIPQAATAAVVLSAVAGYLLLHYCVTLQSYSYHTNVIQL